MFTRALYVMFAIGGSIFAIQSSRKSTPVSTTQSPISTPSPESFLTSIPLSKLNRETLQYVQGAIEKARKHAGEARSWVLLGDALAQSFRDSNNAKFYDYTEGAYQFALGLDARSADALCGLAWVYGGRHLFTQSMEFARQALALDEMNHTAVGILGDAELELGNYDAALDHYQEMMDLRPDLSSWSRGAHALWLTGNKSKAIWLMERAIKAGSPFAENTAWCRAQLALMLFNDGALPAAAQILEPALQATSHNPHVLLAAGRIAIAQGNFEAAGKHFEALLESGPHHEALVRLGDLHASQGNQAEADKCFAAVESLHASTLAAGGHDHMAMAKFYADHDRNLPEAVRLAEQHKDSRNVVELDVLAWVYHKSGDQARAIAAMKRALRLNTQDAEMHFHAGMIAATAGDTTSASKHLQTALSLNPLFHPQFAPLAAKTLEQLATPVTAGLDR